MSWSLEIAVLPASGELGLEYYVPDVFCPTGRTVNFEEAASVAIVPQMCAARIGERVVVLDVGCRIVRSCVAFLDSIDAPVDSGYFYRITNHPVEAVVENGEEIRRTRGVPELLALIDGVSEVVDKEDAAILAMNARTGLNFPSDFQIKYMEFGPD